MTEQFLRLLYDELDGQYFTIWTLQDHASHWFSDPTTAATLATSLAASRDVYCSVAFASSPGDAHHRIRTVARSADDIAASGIVGLYADVDFGKPGYPPDAEQAQAVLALAPTPTVLVHSGHGLQAWWLFQEPWTFDCDRERDSAIQLTADWHATISAHARSMGYAIDAGAKDIARVLRVAGTTNHKAEPVSVVLLSSDGPRYNPSELREACTATGTPAHSGNGHLDRIAEAEFPMKKHAALLENDTKYRDSWQHNRPDMPTATNSEFDLSLCNRAALAGWSAGELAALIRQHRAMYGETLKADRVDYVAGTVGKALAAKQQCDNEAEAKVIIEDRTTTDRDEALHALATLLRIDLVDVQRIAGQNPLLRFTVSGRVAIIPQELLPTQDAFRRRLFGLTDKMPRLIGTKDTPNWDAYCEMIVAVAERLETGHEATLDGELEGLIEGFLANRPPVEIPAGTLVDRPECPFTRDGATYIRAAELTRWCNSIERARFTRTEILQRLRGWGATPATHAVRLPNGQTGTRGFWRIPTKGPDKSVETNLSDLVNC